ncbi:MAG: DUF47 family protein [Planctomycetota bacterium]|nr:DUF47 family protein [Planctomycetota bacterium]
MSFSLFPKTVEFYELFRQQNKKLVEAATVLDQIFSEFSGVPAKCKRINAVEAEGNPLSRDIAKQLSLTFITPIDREDIQAINLAQEDVINLIKAISTRIGLYGFQSVGDAARHLVGNLKAMIVNVGAMLEQMIAKKDVDELSQKVKQLKLESESLLLVALGEIYERKIGGADEVMDIFKWSQIYDRIEEAINRTEHLANVVEGICIKYA